MKTISMFLIALLTALALSCGNQTDDPTVDLEGRCVGESDRCGDFSNEDTCWAQEECRWDYDVAS